MNKKELIEAIAEKSELTKSDANRALDAIVDSVANALAASESVILTGFGTFSVADRPERTGRNPRTGEPLVIEARREPKFKAGKLLKDACN